MKKELIIAVSVVVLIIAGVMFFTREPEKNYLKDNYMTGCTEGNYAMRGYCECTFNKLEKEIGIEGIVEMENEYKYTGELPPKAWKVINQCAYLAE